MGIAGSITITACHYPRPISNGRLLKWRRSQAKEKPVLQEAAEHREELSQIRIARSSRRDHKARKKTVAAAHRYPDPVNVRNEKGDSVTWLGERLRMMRLECSINMVVHQQNPTSQ